MPGDNQYAAVGPDSSLVEVDLDPTFSDAVTDAYLSVLVNIPSTIQPDLIANPGTSWDIVSTDGFVLSMGYNAGAYQWSSAGSGAGLRFATVTFNSWVQVEIHAVAGASTYDVRIGGTLYSARNAPFLPASGVNSLNCVSVPASVVGDGGGSAANDTIGFDELSWALDNWISQGGTAEKVWAFDGADPIGDSGVNYPTPPWAVIDNGALAIATGGGTQGDADAPAAAADVMTSPGAGRVLIALSDGPLVADPTWTRYDNITACRCFGYDCFAGRQSELDTTDTGSASVYFHDQDGTLDDSDLVGCQIMLQLYNPVLAEWQIRWRGHIDDIQHNLLDTPNFPAANASITATGIFDLLGGMKFVTDGSMGDGVVEGSIFYEDEPVNDRVVALLLDAGIVGDMEVHTSGNVDVNETLYDTDDVILQALRDTADAEFPGIANLYEDRFGRVCWHGRFSRFDPEGTAADIPGQWDFTRWDAATREDVTTGVAQVRSFTYNRPRSRIINSYLAYPREDENGVTFDRALIPTLQKTDPASIAQYGYRGGEAPDLIIKKQKIGGNGNTGAEECQVFGNFYITNYSTARKAVQEVTIMALPPTDVRAAATWDLMCRCDISDVINLTIDEASIADEAFFIDGITVECKVANIGYDMVTVTPNLTPADYYGDVPDEF